MERGLAYQKPEPPDGEPSPTNSEVDMCQSSTLFIGMDVHKDSIAVAYIAQDHGC
jgi:hypothetical protein